MPNQPNDLNTTSRIFLRALCVSVVQFVLQEPKEGTTEAQRAQRLRPGMRTCFVELSESRQKLIWIGKEPRMKHRPNPARPLAGTKEIEQEKTEATEIPISSSVISVCSC